ncbi:MAG: GNAT family N-acetyltransferase [Candidatus Bipolaricaulota bacterium]
MTYQLPDGFAARPATIQDAEQVAALWNQRSEATRGEHSSTPERVLSIWDHPKFDLSTDSRLVFAPEEKLIGYAHIRDVKTPPVDVFSGYSVHPNYDHSDWLWNDLFRWMEVEARRVIPKAPEDARIALVAGTSEQDVTEQHELERQGFEYSRTFHWMQIDFGAPEDRSLRPEPGLWPDGIRVRNVVPGEDDIELVTVYREAFADHYGIIHQPFEADLEEWRDLMQEDDFDASLWFLAHAVEDNTIAGFCVCHTTAHRDQERGMINDLGVRPAWRRRGIGRALLLHAFAELARRGIKGAALNVDTGNKSGAPALYEHVGMHSAQASHTYVKELRPGVNLVPQ